MYVLIYILFGMDYVLATNMFFNEKLEEAAGEFVGSDSITKKNFLRFIYISSCLLWPILFILYMFKIIIYIFRKI